MKFLIVCLVVSTFASRMCLAAAFLAQGFSTRYRRIISLKLELTDDKPEEPTNPAYHEQMAAGRACFDAGDYGQAKGIYTNLILNPEYRNAVVYYNRCLVNYKLNLFLPSFHDAQQAVILSHHRWRKPIYRAGEAASALKMHSVAERCYQVADYEEKVREARANYQINLEASKKMHAATATTKAKGLVSQSHGHIVIPEFRPDQEIPFYKPRPQLPNKNLTAITQIIEKMNYQHGNVVLKDAPGMGRGISATRTISEGDIVLVEEPFVAAFAHGDRCQQCFRELTPTPDFPIPPPAVVCGGCGVERYCSEACRDKAWELYHRVQCKHAHGIKDIRDACAAGLTTAALAHTIVARLIGMTMCSPHWPCHTLSLPQMQLLNPAPNHAQMVMNGYMFTVSYDLIANALKLRDEPRFDLEWFEAVYMIVINNAFVISREGDYRLGTEGSKLGSGIYPFASMLNHNCVPNTEWLAGCCDLPGRAFNSLVVVATKEIKAGEQVFISYFDRGQPYEARNLICQRYGFKCRCELCLAEENK